MQLITTASKSLLLVLLSCSVFIVWQATNYNNIAEINSISVSEVVTPAKKINHSSSAVSIWTKMSSEFELDNKAQSSQVQAEIRKLLADQRKLNQILLASAPYIYFIHKQTKAYGLPAELGLIPFIESEFNPNDHSNKGALGLWQLMSGTAHELGVKIKPGYDGRRNVVDSTKAALAYFRDLGNMFNGNWYLAIAAYNCGQGRILSAMHRSGSKSFWNLSVPKETQYYVPKLLAIAEIIKNPDKYGVQLPEIKNVPYFTEVKLDKPVNLNKVVESAGVNQKTFQVLNPDFKPGVGAKDKATILVPLDKAAVVSANL